MMRSVLQSFRSLCLTATRWPVVGPMVRKGLTFYRLKMMEAELRRAHHFPPDVVVELTNFCNAKCWMCPNPTLKRPRGYMGDATFDRLMVDCGRHAPVPMIGFAGVGENLLHPRFSEYSARMRKIGQVMVLSTNAIHMTSALADTICRLYDDVWISINAATSKDYAMVMGVPAEYFERVVANINLLLSAREAAQRTMSIRLRMTAWDDARFDANEAITNLSALFGRRIDSIEVSGGFNCAGAVKRRATPAPSPTAPVDDICGHPWQHLQVHWDGSIGLCCQDSEGIFGATANLNINSKTISEIWNDNAFRRYRRASVAGEIRSLPLCRACVTGHQVATVKPTEASPVPPAP